MTESITFYLPLGLSLQDGIHRKGSMHLATTLDELEIQGTDEVGVNPRYRDILLLSRVIDELDGIAPVTPEMIEDLFEADFLYLQLLYKELNGETTERTYVTCPRCSSPTTISLKGMYRDMSVYKQTDEDGE
ncbi:MAG TPA: hypothetical protein PLV73_10180 [Treponemataceae bacterium]|nr:MAG: hypothetical protein BWY20_01982 [Spirochaetes bacterium ADurb.Bin215]HPA11172.1 hypothetical protein [Treponemataceae bacterium]